MTGEDPVQVPFEAHVELLRLFLTHRKAIVERIQEQLNAQRMPDHYLRDRPGLARRLEDCFFGISAVTPEQSRLRGQLLDAHWESGFRPRQVPGLHNDLIDPAEMMIRGFYCWQQTRWPGRNARLRYAQTLFDLYMIRCLMLLSMRVCSAGPSSAGERLAEVQSVLDALWQGAPADQVVLVRDARWLIPLAQSPTTDELAAYFEVAESVAESLPKEASIEIQKAHVRMLGGHLTTQIRHYCLKEGLSLDDHSVVVRTRTSNALDFALLVQGLVPLLEAYDRACQTHDDETRRGLAGAIVQGISPDPEVFVKRLDLLGAYSMIEHPFVAAEGGRVDYTPMGRRHMELLGRYGEWIGRLAPRLHEDCLQFKPVEGVYSPFGAIFGTPSNLLEHMALKTLQRDAVARLGVEDVFVDGDAETDRIAWVNGWRRLPHIDPQVQKLHEYPSQFAGEVFDRIEQTLRSHVEDAPDAARFRTGRLCVVPGDDAESAAQQAAVAELPSRYFVTSDPAIAAALEADVWSETQLLRERLEGHFVVSYATPGGWTAIRKDMLTEVLGEGRDAKIPGLPAEAAGVLRLTCPGLVAPERTGEPA